MKLGIFLLVVAVSLTYAFFLPYFQGYKLPPNENIGGGLVMWLIAFPCYYKGIKRIKKYRKQKESLK